MNKQETIADIIAEMCGGPIPQHRHDRELLRYYADRLEAAHRRELSKIVSKNGSDFGQLGDAAKLREALKSLMDNLRIHAMMPCQDITMNHAEVDAMIEDCRAALAAPPRNCDVGTEQEQARRFLKYCVKQDCEKACPFRDCKNSHECPFAWSKMPYEEGGANE